MKFIAMKKKLFFALLVLSFVACKRFDSNAYNHRMIQGSWKLNSIWSKKDSSSVIMKNKPTLVFLDSICSEQYIDSLNINIDYKFQINSYHLLLTDSVQNKKNNFLISKLIRDSLILENDTHRFTYLPSKD